VYNIRIFLLVLAAVMGAAAFYVIQESSLDSYSSEKNFQSSSNSNQKGTVTNLTSEEFTTTSSGLQYRIINEGSGTESPGPESVVSVHYRGKLTNGTEFDSSYQRNQPASFPVNGVIKGWTEALQLMKEGDKWELVIPPDLGYGSRGAGKVIPADATLIFEVELLEIK
jgi:FKBP-type peptidyl-prolyl cis-trans isomerase